MFSSLHLSCLVSKSIRVAVFDVLRKPSSHSLKNAFVLLQPFRPLDEILPNFTPGHPSLNLDKPKSVFVGMVKETGSLFAMTQDHFPLVAFSGADSYARSRLIDASDADFPPGVDDITKMRQSQKEIMEALERCEGDGVHYDRRCLIGIHEIKDADGPENRWKRLLDAPKNSRLPVQAHPAVDHNRSGLVRIPTGDVPTSSSSPRLGEDGAWGGRNGSVNGMQAVMLTLIIGVLSLWLGLKRMRESRKKGLVPVTTERHETKAAVGLVVETPTSESDLIPPPSVNTDKSPPQVPEPTGIPNGAPSVTELEQKLLPQANGNGHDYAGAGEDSDREGDADGGDVNATITPGKRKTRRGKRGKKKKAGTAEPVAEAEEEETAKGTTREDLAEPNPSGSASPSPTLIINSPKPPAATTSLVVSETILGMFPYLSNHILVSIGYHSLLPRIRITWHCRFPRVTAGPSRRRQAFTPRFCNSCCPRSKHPPRKRRSPQRHSLLLPRSARQLPLHRPRALSRFSSGHYRIS